MSKINPLIKTISATATGEIDLTQEILGTPHVFIGMIFLDGGGSTVTPSGGTFSLEVSINGMEAFEAVSGSTDFNATLPLVSFSYSGNAHKLKYIPNGVTGAVNVKITLTGNES